ncbi:hypothetical protein IV203_010227 [Nitzschia inconspicua]|uniref:Uncharacterized protein n=1 Tax=Nitzschia inconspicua TaxID=303405 RepID=A0A9K3KVX0_9STRA|nr:hypothetical protein IV203_010227 [Nitzschia inconspicua]
MAHSLIRVKDFSEKHDTKGDGQCDIDTHSQNSSLNPLGISSFQQHPDSATLEERLIFLAHNSSSVFLTPTRSIGQLDNSS